MIRFILNVIKGVWEHRRFVEEMGMWEFDGNGKFYSVTTKWFELSDGTYPKIYRKGHHLEGKESK